MSNLRIRHLTAALFLQEQRTQDGGLFQRTRLRRDSDRTIVRGQNTSICEPCCEQ